MKISEFDTSRLHLMSTVDLQELQDELVAILSRGACINTEETIGLMNKIQEELATR